MPQARSKPQKSGILLMLRAAWDSMFSVIPPDRDLDRTLVSSSVIVAAGYKRTSQTLQVEYFGGWVCETSGVPNALYKQLMQADDFDAVFRDQIQTQYPMDRVGRLLPVFGG